MFSNRISFDIINKLFTVLQFWPKTLLLDYRRLWLIHHTFGMSGFLWKDWPPNLWFWHKMISPSPYFFKKNSRDSFLLLLHLWIFKFHTIFWSYKLQDRRAICSMENFGTMVSKTSLHLNPLAVSMLDIINQYLLEAFPQWDNNQRVSSSSLLACDEASCMQILLQ